MINSEAFARATAIVLRAIRARGHVSSEAFAESATDADELAVMDEGVANATPTSKPTRTRRRTLPENPGRARAHP
ncbi:MAG: hypothetical protein ACHREM_07180, partial [Polyangiales bacterium]